ncbi:DNA-processing protein DprA [Kocuria sp.]|uniref:DNA-processing protein DprA n=1 Tax=Kocuria sp. TaxID=1871328 RepID=UPI0026E04A7B|nr:DNA-processing protein DprA [Kocuria sp.]MDO5618284.1 DNA-processing protein DprA [Kocuria sp.]
MSPDRQGNTSAWQSHHIHQIRMARIGLSVVLEPRDLTGHLILRALGPVAAWGIISGERGVTGEEHHALELTIRECGKPLPGLGGATGARAVERWSARAAQCDPERMWDRAQRQGLWMCLPEESDWPPGLHDLQETEPVCLWGRGERGHLAHLAQHTVAVVGSRDCSTYGRAVTFEIAGALAARGWSILSGGAYGVDEAAHRAALAAGTSAVPTVAVMAGGVDRLYPRGNQELLHQVADQGLVISEAAPGTMPARFRFLDRNRLIAALATGTVVTESRWRSGAQSTAHHAAELSRPVGAVPGSVQSATSAGCHRLIREGSAVLVTDADDVLALIGPVDAPTLGTAGVDRENPQLAIFDGLSEADRQLADALPVVQGATVDSLAGVAGLPTRQVLGGLRRLERAGLAVDRGGLWVRPRQR